MLKYYLCLYLLFYLIQSVAQSTIVFKQGFELEGDNWAIQQFSTQPCTINGDTWNYHNELGGILPSNGNRFWGIQDLNGNCGSSGFEYFELSAIDISNLRDVLISFDYMVLGFDNGDDIKYTLWLDGQPQDEVVFIDGQNDLSTDSWQSFQIQIPNQINEVKLRISVKQNGSDIAALDNFILRGQSIEKCKDLFISEYIEGLSSPSFRNNYIELYNASNDTLDLSAYKLNKYTGANLESTSLALSGSIAPYDTFLIEDSSETQQIEADLSTNSSVMDYNGDDKIAITRSDTIIDLIGIIGDSGNFAKDQCLRRKSHVQTPNNEYNMDEWELYNLNNTKDLNHHTSQCEGDFPEIDVNGNNEPINDQDETTSISNNTYFGTSPVSDDTIISKSFRIKNTGKKELIIHEVNLLNQLNSNYSHDFTGPATLMPNDSVSLQISYKPTTTGLHSATIEIINNDPSESNFNFIVKGEGTSEVDHPLIISQYYEGSANNKWIEVTNITNKLSPENTYYLALYRNPESQNPVESKPYRKVLIPAIAANSSLKFCATLNITMPAYALDGNEIKTSVCTFTGDDIIVISTSGEENCWLDRTDIIGKSENWGSNTSLIRKSDCEASLPNTGFITSNWKEIPTTTVDQAISGSNEMIGVHYSLQTTWTQTGWSNGVPDANHTAIISHDYNTSTDGNLTACSLRIEEGKHLMVTSGQDIEVKKQLIVDGQLEIQNNGSFMMIEDSGLIETQGSIKIHKTSNLLRPLDYTYWSSPVSNAYLEQVFEASPQNSFFVFSTQNYQDANKDGNDDNQDAWVGVSGLMEVGRGYTSMAPDPIPVSKKQNVVFEGNPNSGEISIPIKIQLPEIDGPAWNLIGNPYPSALDVEKMVLHPNNSNLLYGSFYFWTHQTEAARNDSIKGYHYSPSDYAMYTIGVGGIKANPNGVIPSQYISSCQGFFVEAKNEGNLILNNSMRDSNSKSHFYKPAKDKNSLKIWLNLTHSEGAFSQILISFNALGKDKFDKQYDGERILNSQNINFYSIVDNHKLAIQSLPPISGNEKISLGITSTDFITKNLGISIDSLQGKMNKNEVILTDKLLKRKHHLKRGPYYFDLHETGPLTDRFELSFINREDPITKKNSSKLTWNLNDNQLIIKTSNLDSIKRVAVYDLNGRKLRDLNVYSNHAYVNWHGLPRRAIYILKVQLTDSRNLVSKILI